MRLENDFVVPVEPRAAFATLSDIERIAPCLPGARLDTCDGDQFAGHLSVGIGPVRLKMAATGTVVRRDDEQRLLVIDGHARDRSGQGAADAHITLTVHELGTGRQAAAGQSQVTVVTELALSGRLGQFGGSAISQINRRLVGQFVRRLDDLVQADHPGQAAAAATVHLDTSGATPTRRQWSTRITRRGVAAPVVATVTAAVVFGIAVVRALRSEATGQNRLQLHGRATR